MKAGLMFALAGTALVAACQTPCPQAAPRQSQVTYACADGSRLAVAFDRAAGRAFVSEDAGAALNLAVQISGIGFRYTGEGASLRGRGPAAQWISPAGVETSCTIVE